MLTRDSNGLRIFVRYLVESWKKILKNSKLTDSFLITFDNLKLLQLMIGKNRYAGTSTLVYK